MKIKIILARKYIDTLYDCMSWVQQPVVAVISDSDAPASR